MTPAEIAEARSLASRAVKVYEKELAEALLFAVDTIEQRELELARLRASLTAV